jgi:hypothetical protein
MHPPGASLLLLVVALCALCTLCTLPEGSDAAALFDKPPALPRYLESGYQYEVVSPYRPGYFSSNATGNGTVWVDFDTNELRMSGVSLWRNTENEEGTWWSYDERFICSTAPPIFQNGLQHLDGTNQICLTSPVLFSLGMCKLLGDGQLPELGTLGTGEFADHTCLTYTYKGVPQRDDTLVLYFQQDSSHLPVGFVLQEQRTTSTITLTDLKLVRPPSSVFDYPPVECTSS